MPMDDYQEIAHCGGIISVIINYDPHRKLNVVSSAKIKANRNKVEYTCLMASLLTAEPIHNYPENRNEVPFGLTPVFMGADTQGKFMRRCPACQRNFRASKIPVYHAPTCPYCGMAAPSSIFFTDDQRRYIAHYVNVVNSCLCEKMDERDEIEIEIDVDAILDLEPSERPAYYYVSESQQTIFECKKCNCVNDIIGVYGYCHSCSYRNNFDNFVAEKDRIRENLNSGRISEISAVKEIVSKFDGCCEDILRNTLGRIPMKPSRRAMFERMKFYKFDSDNFSNLKAMIDIDMMKGISNSDLTFLKMMVSRRHIYEHKNGIVDDAYIRDSGDKSAMVGELLREKRENVHKLIGILSRIVGNMQNEFHEIFPITRDPIAAEAKNMRV